MISLAALAASARNTFYVVPEGTEGNTPASPYNSWETAANELADVMDILPETTDEASSSDILVKPGVYYPTRCATTGNYRYYVTIRSCDPLTGEIDPEGTVFDGSKLPFDENGVQPRLLLAEVLDSSWQIRGLTFRNVASGGAIKLMNGCSGFCIADCIFHDNVCSNDQGGAIYAYCDSGQITNCVFRNNRSIYSTGGGAGGAIRFQLNSDGVWGFVEGCIFENNSSGVDGGGSINTSSGGAVISNCTFTGTCGGQYGAVLSMSAASRVIGCAFTNLTLVGGTFGAVIGTKNGDDVYEVTDCSFVDCCRGAAQLFNLYGSSFRVRNTLFADTVGSSAPAVWLWDGPMRFENCTIAGFPAGHSFRSESEAEQATYVNCILPTLVNCNDYTTRENTYVISESGDPFVSIVDRDYRLLKTSPCVDAGQSLDWHAGATDVAGRDRVVGAAVDIGCYERQPRDPARYYYRAVSCEADKTGNWAGATVGIQAAIDAAPAGSYVAIRSGTWNIAKTITIYGKSLTVCGLNAETDEIDCDGTVLDGGNARRIMQATNRSEPIFDNGVDVYVGEVGGPVFIEGITFSNGNATAGTTLDEGGVIRDADGHRVSNDGGGLWMRGDTGSNPGIVCPRVRNCRFVGNAAADGGGLYLAWGGIAEDCVFETNEASGVGGGLCGHDWAGKGGTIAGDGGWANPLAIRCTFLRNHAVGNGGGYADSADFTCFRIFAKDCFFDGNRSEGSGGNFAGGNGSIAEGCTFANGVAPDCANMAIKNDSIVTGCTFTGGTGTMLRMYPETGSPIQMTDCVISNTAGGMFFQGAMRFRNVLMADVQGDIYLYYPKADGYGRVEGGEYRFENCTFANCAQLNVCGFHRDCSIVTAVMLNTIADCPIVCAGRYGSTDCYQALAATNCCFKTMPQGDDTFQVDPATCFAKSPRFVDAASGNYALRTGSPCRDRGRMLDWMTASSKDLGGQPRVVTAGVPLAENPDAIPDIGCYECQLCPKGMVLSVQ